MRKLFDINGPVITVLTKIFDLLILSILWVVFSLPVVTMGAACAGAYAVINKYMKKNEGYFWKTFWGTFVDYLKHHLGTWFIALIGLVILLLDAVGLRSMKLQGMALGELYWVVLFLIALYVTWMLYLSAYIALVEGNTKEVLRLSLLMVVLHPGKAFINMVLVIMGAALLLAAPVAVTIIPAVMLWLTSYEIEQVFAMHLPEEDARRLLGKKRTDEKDKETDIS